MARQDWNIERKEISRTTFPDIPGAVEVLRVQFLLSHKTNGIVIPAREDNFVTPTDADLMAYENKLISRVERGLAAASVTLGVIDTSVIPPSTEQVALNAYQQADRAYQAQVALIEKLKADNTDPQTVADLDAKAVALKVERDKSVAAATDAVLAGVISSGGIVGP